MASSTDVNGFESSAAQRLMQQHESDSHRKSVLVEDVEDEDLPLKSSAPKPAPLDTQSHEAFPELGAAKGKAPANVAPVWSAKGPVNGKSNGTTPVNGTPRALTPASGMATPTSNAPKMSIPGRHVETVYLDPDHILPRNQLRRPVDDLANDITRKSRISLKTTQLGGGRLRIDASGPQDKAQQAIRDLVQQIGTKQTVTVSIPRSARAHIIGKQGSTIKSLQERTGARIQLPKVEDQNGADEDDDGFIDVTVEGNSLTAAAARDAINKIASERAGNVNTKLKTVPAEFFPFIAGPNNSLINALEANHGVQIRVPPHQPFCPVPNPGSRPAFVPANNDNHIQLAGDRTGVMAARAAIERQVQQLQTQLQMEQTEINRGRHQFIIGDRGIPMDQFFADTNCSVLLPKEEGVDTVTIIGSEEDINRGLDKVSELAMNLNQSFIDISRALRGSSGVTPEYARDVSRYLKDRNEVQRLEGLHQIYINTPSADDGGRLWELYARDGKNILKAQKDVSSILTSHPPSRLMTVPVDPFYHQYLQSTVKSRVQTDYGVYLVIPEASESHLPVVLVFEDKSTPEQAYQVPQQQPSAEQIRQFKAGLDTARKDILDLINKQEKIKTESLDVPIKYHEKLRRYIKNEQDSTIRTAGEIPVRVSVRGTTVTMRGPTSAVESLSAKSRAFVEQEKEDEKERGFTMKFDFPKNFEKHLIGKGGSNIKELRERFDIEIQVGNGEVELKGPKAKAEKAKAHIMSLGRTMADEATHTLKIEPKYHRELIGAQGSQITRLQERYDVHINFPRTARPAKDDESVADGASEAGKPRRQQGPDEVIIRGPKKSAGEARDEIYSLYQYLKDNGFVVTVSVQQKQLPSLIGAGGAGMDELRQATGAKIDIPNERSEDQDTMVEIQIKGTKTAVAAAKKLIEEKKAVFEDTVAKSVDVDRKWHKILIGPGGSTLRDIIIKAGGPEERRLQSRTIQFPKQDADGNTIKIEGRQDVVDKIISTIQAMVSERESQVTEIADVPVEKHRTLIGRGGDAKRKLEGEFKVSIDIPRQGSSSTSVKVTGLPADVERAKAHILSIIKEQQGETVQVPRKYHNAISDNGSFFRQIRNDHKVTVDHAGEKVPAKPKTLHTRATNGAMPLITDDPEATADAHSWVIVDNASSEEGDIPWVLKGSPEGIERVKKAIAAALEHAKKNTSTGYLTLPDPTTYRHVIGSGGSKVNSIRKQSGCKINVPRNQNRDEPIEVLGSREGCEMAKQLILDAVREGQAGRPRD